MRVLVFGDSITQGYWDSRGGWVERLREYFDKKQMSDLKNQDQPSVFNLGISADNSSNILTRIKSETLSRTRPSHASKPSILVQIGINDSCACHGKLQNSLEQYSDNLRRIYSSVQGVCSSFVFVGLTACDESKTTPTFWGDYIYSNKNIESYENEMKKIAAELNAPFILLFRVFKNALDNNKEYLADGLHPNDEGHDFVYSIVVKELEELLN